MSNRTAAIEWFSPRMTGGELDAIKTVLDSGYINDGDVTSEFEQQISNLVGRKYAVAVPSGTTAIALALVACGAGHGLDVIVPDLTFIATANAARLAGAGVVLADVDPKTLCLTAATVDAARARNPVRRPKYVVAVEVNGRCSDYVALSQYCRDNSLTLITDSCEALGSTAGALALGSFGAASCLSFSPNKIVTTGQGGMVLTDDFNIYERLRQLKYQGRGGPGSGGNDVHPTIGFNFKFTDIQAAFGMAQLKALNSRIAHARLRDKWYRAGLSGTDVDFLENKPGAVCLWADVMVPDPAGLAMWLQKHDVFTRQFWLPLHRQSPYASLRDFPAATSMSGRGLWLPSGHDITESEVGRVVDYIKGWLRHA